MTFPVIGSHAESNARQPRQGSQGHHQNHNFQSSSSLSCSIKQIRYSTFLKAALLQLDFPSFLRERARTAAPRTKAIARRLPTNAIALTDLLANAELKPGGRYGVRGILSPYASC